MKAFKLKFKNYIVALAYLGVATFALVLGLTVFRCIKNGDLFEEVYNSLQYVILFFVSVFGCILLLSVVHNSKYVITDKEFVTSFGFIKSKFLISDMTKAVFNKQTCQLAIYFGEEFMVFRLDEHWSREFIDLLKSKNKKILYDETEDFEKENNGNNGEKTDDKQEK